MPETYTCQKCGKVAKTKQALERHAAYHEDDRPYSCEVCLQRFKNSDDRGKHYRRLKRDGKFAFACQVCHKHFKGQDLLAKHLEILGCLLKQAKPVSGPNDGGGETAEGMAKSKTVKAKQMKVEEELVLENDVKCTCKVCETEFIGTDNLRRHYRDVHNDNKRQVCIHCGQTLSSKDSLARHYSIFHQNNYPFQCELCDQKFKIKESLCRHVKFVHKDGGYPCEICQRVFSQPVNLKKHMAMHTNSKEFSCCVCGREFRWKQALQKHMQLHTGSVMLKSQVSVENEHGDAENNVVISKRSGDDNLIDKIAKGGQHIDTNECTSVLDGSSPVAPDSLTRTENKGFISKTKVKEISYKNRNFDKNGKNVAFQIGSTEVDGTSVLVLDHWNEDLFSSKHSFEEIPSYKTRKFDCTDWQRSPETKTNASVNQEITEATKHRSPEPKVSNDKPDSALNDLATIIISYAKKDSSKNTDSVVDKEKDYRKIVVESESNRAQKPCVDKVQEACSPDLTTVDMDVDIEADEFEQFIESKSEHDRDVDTHPGTPDVQINDISCVEMDSCEATTSGIHCMSDSEIGVKPTLKNNNATLNWKKTRWYNRSLSGSKTAHMDSTDENFDSSTQEETVDSNFQSSSQDSRSGKNRMQNCDDNNITYAQPRKKFKTYNSGIYTSVPTSEEENAPRLVFRPSSIKDILRDKKRDDVEIADKHAARSDTGERKAGSSRSEFKALLQTANAASTFRKTHNPFLIPFSPQTDKEETENTVTSKTGPDQEIVSSTKKSKQIPNIPGAYKFSLVKHMLSLKNEEHFDKELFRNPLYNTQVDVKSLTHIIERHKVENTDNMYDLSARQICPFQWVGVRVNKNDSAASRTDKHVDEVEDECSQSTGVKGNPDNEAVDICGEISVKKQELERKKEAQSNSQVELEISSHTDTVGHATVGKSSGGESRGELSETASVLNELTARNGSPGSEAKLAPPRASSGSSMAKIKRYEIMKDLVKCTKYHNTGATNEISLLRNPFEINPAHINRVSDKSKPDKFVSDINDSSDCYMKGINNICSRATEDVSGQTRVSEIHNKMKMVHEVGTNSGSDEVGDGLEESEGKITPGFEPVASFSVENESINLTTNNMAASYGMCSIRQSLVSTCSREISTIPSTSNVTYRNHRAIQGAEMSPVSSVERKIQGNCFPAGRDSNSVGWTKDAGVISVSSEQNDFAGLKARAISWQGSKIQMVPKFQESSSNHLCHVAKVTAAETSLPETIAQELNQVLCSSLQNDTIFVDDLPTDLTTHQTSDGTSIAKHNIPARSVGNSELRNRNLGTRVNSSAYRQAQGDNQTQVRPSFGHSVHETVAGNRGNFCSMENSTRQAPSFPGTVSATATMSSTAIGKGWSRGLVGKTFSARNEGSVSSTDSGKACLKSDSLERVRDSSNKFQMLPKGQISVYDLLASQGNRQHRFENLDKMLDSFIT